MIYITSQSSKQRPFPFSSHFLHYLYSLLCRVLQVLTGPLTSTSVTLNFNFLIQLTLFCFPRPASCIGSALTVIQFSVSHSGTPSGLELRLFPHFVHAHWRTVTFVAAGTYVAPLLGLVSFWLGRGSLIPGIHYL